MAEKLEYTIALNDLISAAAEKAGGSLHKLTLEFGEVEKSTHHLDKEVEKVEFHEILHHAIEGVTVGMRSLASGLKDIDLGKTLEGATEAASGLAQTLDLLYPGLGQVASGAIKAAGGIAELGAALVETALEETEFNEKVEATFEALGDPGSGKPTLDFLNEMATQLPQSRKQLADWTKQFEAMGVTDLGELRDQIRATASAQAILGEEGAGAYQMLTRRIKDADEGHQKLKLSSRQFAAIGGETGAIVASAAARMNLPITTFVGQLKSGSIDAGKFGDALEGAFIEKGEKPLEAMGNEIGTIKTKLSETIGHLFDDVDTSPIIDAIKSVIDLGDQGEPSGSALKDGMTSGINAISLEIGKLIHEGELMFLDMELWWLKNQKEIKTAESDIKLVASAFGTVFTAAEKVLEVVEKIGAAIVKANPLHAIGNLMFSGENAQLDYEAKQRSQQPAATLPPHASGGIVAGISGGIATVRPAHGEGLVSIGHGEQIIPRGSMGGAQMIPPDAYRGMRQSVMSAANDNGGSRAGASNTVHIEHLSVHAAAGITNAQDVTITGLTLAFERLQLANGR